MTKWWSGDNIGNLRKGVVMKFGKIGAIVIGLVPFNVYAECTPTPDCASIGYTETSCEGDSLKCPFDITKMMCMPCDSSFRYDCSGENITGGTGSACGGKYVSCECSEGSVFKDGACACDDSCTVGAIYYSDGSCSVCVVNIKTPIGVVVKENELVMSPIAKGYWGASGTDIPDLTNYATSSEAITDFNGKNNTDVIIATHISLGLTATESAAVYCSEYSTLGTNSGDWYLPAAGELYSYVYNNHGILNSIMNKLGWSYGSNFFWSSSEYGESKAWRVCSYYDGVTTPAKYNSYWVSCFIRIGK